MSFKKKLAHSRKGRAPEQEGSQFNFVLQMPGTPDGGITSGTGTPTFGLSATSTPATLGNSSPGSAFSFGGFTPAKTSVTSTPASASTFAFSFGSPSVQKSEAPSTSATHAPPTFSFTSTSNKDTPTFSFSSSFASSAPNASQTASSTPGSTASTSISTSTPSVTSGSTSSAFTASVITSAPKSGTTSTSSSSIIPSLTFNTSFAPSVAPSIPTIARKSLDDATTAEQKERLNKLKASWDPASPDCIFKHYFYNMVHPSEVQYYQCPPNQPLDLWQEAQRRNPDPTCMVPVLFTGFEDIKRRTMMQERISRLHMQKLDEISDTLNNLRLKNNLETSIKAHRYRQDTAIVAHRLLKLMSRTAALSMSGQPLEPSEEQFLKRMLDLQALLQQPETFDTKINKIYNTMLTIKTQRDHTPHTDQSYSTTPVHLDMLQTTLSDQLQGIKHLQSSIKHIEEHLHVIERLQ